MVSAIASLRQLSPRTWNWRSGKVLIHSFPHWLLGPSIVNILLYHLLWDHAGAPLAIIVAIIWGVLFFRHHQYFSSLFVQRTS